ncbi:NAD-dependent epimerase/dehydratase family protein [Glaciihabitans sp. INWT7]|uniref:NAD-dependent epimerase/dehydratase family protein n=1 Tax=Glaciihabitans sp. INWT7 TaxID=2596912 RepID=UPI0016241D19|nr:NAD-dependent epimerase/dehydratase family protein [Glaciihabitans sp. INWT7]
MRVILTGGRGMLGSSIAERWAIRRPYDELVLLTRDLVDLRDKDATREAVERIQPDSIVHAAAVVGGLAAKLANPTKYLLDNLLLDSSVISAAIDARVPELLYIGSAAVYPEHYRQPFLESDLLAAPLEPANEGYAIAKIAGIKLCEYASSEFGLDYRVALPSNLYGPNDDYSLSHGHLIAAAIAKVHAAHIAGDASVLIWGDGTARREFTYSLDLADWLVSQVGALSKWPTRLNLGVGHDHTITEYYDSARRAVGYAGGFQYDTGKPAGMRQRILDSGVAHTLGWLPQTALDDGIARVYQSYLAAQQE